MINDIDSTGKIFIWKDESQPSPLKNLTSIENNSLLLELCNNEEQELFSLVNFILLTIFSL